MPVENASEHAAAKYRQTMGTRILFRGFPQAAITGFYKQSCLCLFYNRRAAQRKRWLQELEAGLECAVWFFFAPVHPRLARDISSLRIQIGPNHDRGAG